MNKRLKIKASQTSSLTIKAKVFLKFNAGTLVQIRKQFLYRPQDIVYRELPYLSNAINNCIIHRNENIQNILNTINENP